MRHSRFHRSCFVLPAVVVMLFPNVVRAQFTFTLNNGAITITGYNGPGGAAVIPNTTNGYPVQSIGAFAFENCSNVTSIVIPYEVMNIGEGAFYRCAGLTNISAVSSNAWFSSVNGVLFDKAQHNLIAYPGGLALSNGTYPIQYGVTNISPYAFASCSGLSNIAGTNFVASIGEFAFSECSNLTSVTLPKVANDIGVAAFIFCTSLTNVVITNNAPTIGGLSFAFCPNLKSAYFSSNAPPDDGTAFAGDPSAAVYYVPGTTGWGATFGGAPTVLETTPANEFEYYLFNGSITIDGYRGTATAVAIPPIINGYPVTSIQAGGFGFQSVTSLIIPDSFTSIGDDAFSECMFLTNVSLPDSVTSIGQSAFDGCESLVNIMIPDSVTNIGQTAFAGCDSLANIIIPNSVTSIGSESFFNCRNLTSVTIPSGVTNIGEAPFGLCSILTNISVMADNPAYVSLDGVLFDKNLGTLIDYPTGLSNGTYAIPNSVTSIGFEAFCSCGELTSIAIPKSLSSIGEYAFINCAALRSAYFAGNAPPDDGTAFSYDSGAIVYYLPGTSGWGTTFGSAATQLWYLPQPTVLSFEPSFGVQNEQFGFSISWATNASVIVEACTNLANPLWIPVATNALSNGTNYFSDSQWTNYPCRFYRVVGP